MAFIQVKSNGKVENFIPYTDANLKQDYFTVTKDQDNKYSVTISPNAPVDMLFSDESDMDTSNQCLEPILTWKSEKSCVLTFWDPRVREYAATGFAFYAILKNYTGSGGKYNPDNNTLSQMFPFRV